MPQIDNIIDFLNKIPNIGTFVKDLQEKGLPIRIGFELGSTSAMAVMLFIAIGMGTIAATLVASDKILNKIIGIALMLIGFVVAIVLFKQQEPSK